jgi:dihydroorotase
MQRSLDDQGVVQSIEMLRLSNFHAHFRKKELMRAVTQHLIRLPRYVLAMPNTGPILTIDDVTEYHRELREIADQQADHEVDFVMTLYLTKAITPAVVEKIANLPFACGIKYYPPEQGATTGSGLGIPLDQCDEVLRAMIANRVRLLGHFETVTGKDGNTIEPKLREGYMVDNVLWGFRDKYHELLVSFEHASTRKAVEWYLADTSGNSFITVTPQHSLFVGQDLDEYGPDLDCMPIPKEPDDREAIVDLVTSGKGGAGGDEAPHLHDAKLNGSKGCWTPHAPEMYAGVFDSRNALDQRFEDFMSLNAPRWWGLPLPDEDDTVTFVRRNTPVPDPIDVPELGDYIVPLGWGPDGDKLTLSFAVV